MKWVLLLALALAMAPATAYADPATLREADALIKSGRPGEAVQKLLPLAQAEANNGVYHYLLGIAYLDAGELDSAIASLKHSLALDPTLLQAKAELGRAYVLNGDSINAYLAFQEVREANPPPEVLAGIERYIDQVAKQLQPAKKVSGALTFTLGHDTNVNSVTDATSVFLPIFGGVRATLSPGVKPQKDQFLALGGYVDGRHDLTANLELVGSAGASLRYEADRGLRDFDTRYASLAGGLQYTAGASQFRVLGVYDRFRYLGSKLYGQGGVALDWRWLTGGPVELDFNYRYTELDYNEANSFRDARRQVVGVALLPSFFGRRLQYAPPIANVYVGEERTRDPAARNLSHSLWGVRAAYFGRVRGRLSIALGGGYEERRYEAPDPVFLDTRRDRQLDLSAGLVWELTPALSVIPGVQWIESRSNIEVFTFRRTLYTVTLRQAF